MSSSKNNNEEDKPSQAKPEGHNLGITLFNLNNVEFQGSCYRNNVELFFSNN